MNRGIVLATLIALFFIFQPEQRSDSLKDVANKIIQKKIKKVFVDRSNWYYSVSCIDRDNRGYYLKVTPKQYEVIEEACGASGASILPGRIHLNPISFVFHKLEQIPFLFWLFIFYFFFNSLMRLPMQGSDFGVKNKVKVDGVNFKSVAGLSQSKKELTDIVNFFHNPKLYKKLKAKVPKGVLLVGPPGNGKTTLARALAGESNASFFSVSASDFEEIFVGVGASRIRSLFEAAAAHAPSIVFIDEIDSLGTRDRSIGMANNQTLNQILSCMDGFKQNANIVVVAATNRESHIDPALLRNGRFDRKVHVSYPKRKDRKEVLEMVSKDITIDCDYFAKITRGMSMADIVTMVNEARVLAARQSQSVTSEILEESHLKVMVGSISDNEIEDEVLKKVVAYHEAGHALVAKKCGFEVPKMTIVPRSRAAGLTLILPKTEDSLEYIHDSMDQISYMFGGVIAEEIFHGDSENPKEKRTFGAMNDIHRATMAARKIVLTGMTESTGTAVDPYHYPKRDYSEKTLYNIDQEVEKIIAKAKKKAQNILIEYKNELDDLATLVLRKMTIYTDEINAVIS